VIQLPIINFTEGGKEMTKKLVMCAAALAFVFSMAIAGTCLADNGPAEMVLKTAEGKKPANFSHAKHQEKMKCADCHHIKGADGKQAPLPEGAAVQKCETCHNADMADPKLNSFKGAAHGLCKECHKKMAAEHPNAPTKCDGCHPKKK